MRTTIVLDDELLARAQQLSGVRARTEVLHQALNALIERESSRRLAALGGSDPEARAAPRRRPAAG